MIPATVTIIPSFIPHALAGGRSTAIWSMTIPGMLGAFGTFLIAPVLPDRPGRSWTGRALVEGANKFQRRFSGTSTCWRITALIAVGLHHGRLERLLLAAHHAPARPGTCTPSALGLALAAAPAIQATTNFGRSWPASTMMKASCR